MKAIEVTDLNYTYPDGTKALQQINFSVDLHRKVALLGSNGSGKTTLLHHLNGLNLPQEGLIKIFNIELKRDSTKEIRRNVGLVFDNPDNQLFATTVFEDIAFGPRNLKLTDELVKKRVLASLQEVDMLDFAHRPPYNLSLGQKKKVAIAGVLAMESKLLILDEPFSGLDPVSSHQLQSILEKLHRTGTTIIISTHDVDFAYTWADEVVILHQGSIMKKGSVSILNDIQLMKDSKLTIPTLTSIFNITPFKPRTVEEASEILKNLVKTHTVL